MYFFALCLAGWLTMVGCIKPAAELPRLDAPFERPRALARRLEAGPLRTALTSCEGPYPTSRYSIAHRGAPLGYPEHTREGYIAAARMGAGVIECDVVPTSDGELVCRHDVCDLHETTNILDTAIAETCDVPFTPAGDDGSPAHARCCTSALTTQEFKSLCGRMGPVDSSATTVQDYLAGSSAPGCGTLMTHRESIALFDALRVHMTPELKATRPEERPGIGSHFVLADRMLADYRAAGIEPDRVWPQSFDLEVVEHWIREAPEFGDRVVYLDGRSEALLQDPSRLISESGALDARDPGELGFGPTFSSLAKANIRILGSPLWMLLTVDPSGTIIPSRYAREARAAGLDLIAWTIERSGSIQETVLPAGPMGSFYFLSVYPALEGEGDILRVLDVLTKDVGVRGVFSDWPATTTYYAHCAPRGH